MAQTVYLCLHTEIAQHGSVVMNMATNSPINPASVSIWSHYVFLALSKRRLICTKLRARNKQKRQPATADDTQTHLDTFYTSSEISNP